MCGGDDHLAWKHPVSLEACRGLRTAEGSIDTFDLGPASWIRVRASPIGLASGWHTVIPFTLHSQTEVTPPPIIVPIPISENPHARMDKLEQRLRQLRTLDGAITWEDFDGALVASLPAKFSMLEIERYTSINCHRIHLRLYSTMIMFFLIVIDVSRRELEALRQRREESITSFISLQPCYAAQFTARPPTSYPRPRAQQTSTHFALRTQRQFSQLGMLLSQTLRKLIEVGLLTTLAPRPLPQPIPPQFRMDLHCQSSVTTNPLPAHTTHAVPPPADDIHFMDFTEPEPIVVDESYEDDEVISDSQASAPFRLVPDMPPLQLTTIGSLIHPCYNIQSPFILSRDPDETVAQDVQATCIVFSADDLPPRGFDHTLPLYIFVGCSGHRVPSILLDNGSTLNVCPLATTVALGFRPSDFDPSSQTVRTYDSTPREVLSTLTLDLQIGSVTFSTLFQKVKFIHEGRVITIKSTGDSYSTSVPVLEISHGDNDLFLTGFTFDEIQTVEHGSTVVLDMMRSMFFLPSLGIGRRQHGSGEFIATIDHDTPFSLGFVPTEVDYKYMALLRNERLRARLLLMPFDYPIHPYKMSLADYFLSDGALGTSTSVLVTPPSLDHTSLLTLYFPEETNEYETSVEIADTIDEAILRDEYSDEMLMVDMSQIIDDVQPNTASPLDLFGVLAIEIVEDVQLVPTPRLPTAVAPNDDVFVGVTSPTMVEFEHVDPPLSFDVLSRFVSRSNDVLTLSSYMDINDEIIQHDSNEDSFSASIRVKEEIQKQLNVGFLLVVKYPKWLANVVYVPKKNGKSDVVWFEECGSYLRKVATTLFHDMMHRDVEVYVEDMIVKF
ncbi:hypothetical protein AAG906_005630 [Vitis piasezkii]